MGKRKGGSSPKQAGSRFERALAKRFGEQRNVGSGAYKGTNKNLTGDLDIHDHAEKPMIKVEAKFSGAVTTSGERSYTLTERVLKQAQAEAEAENELAALAIHFKRGSTWVAMPLDHFEEIVRLAKLGRTHEA